jgi:hypothetical protein
MSKYYTPSIEEFHVGFECEVVQEAKWVKVEVIDSNMGYFERRLNEGESARVKYLDREDIESFGFLDITRTKGNYDSTDEKEKNVFLLLEDLPSIKVKDSRERIIIRIMNNGEIRIQKRYYFAVGQGAYPPYGCWRFDGRDHIFKGKIKNKSELGRVLKMVGVI